MSGYRPAMTFDPAVLLDAKLMHDGPLVVYWGQEGEEFCRHELRFGDRPTPSLRARLARAKPWRFSIRVAPPEGTDLQQFGNNIAARVGTAPVEQKPRPEDKAIWLPGATFARNASEALGSAARVFKALGGIDVSAVQVRVEQWDAAPTDKAIAA